LGQVDQHRARLATQQGEDRQGLCDRWVQLSVLTAIQLYDLMDWLGLSQPSKVVDWLIDVTQHKINKSSLLPFLP
jgi:hypothetical protein